MIDPLQVPWDEYQAIDQVLFRQFLRKLGRASTPDEWDRILWEDLPKPRQIAEYYEQVLKTRFENLIDVLQDKFGNLPTEIHSHLQKISDAKILRQLLLKAVHASDLDEFRRMVPEGVSPEQNRLGCCGRLEHGGAHYE
jgi:hypothetical protein